MLMSLIDPLPRRDDFFPKLRRYHGTQHSRPRFNKAGVQTHDATLCVDFTCQLYKPKSKNLHRDQRANIEDWCEEHGLRLKHDTPYQAMMRATT